MYSCPGSFFVIFKILSSSVNYIIGFQIELVMSGRGHACIMEVFILKNTMKLTDSILFRFRYIIMVTRGSRAFDNRPTRRGFHKLCAWHTQSIGIAVLDIYPGVCYA